MHESPNTLYINMLRRVLLDSKRGVMAQTRQDGA